jgi:hypothetical protein
MAKFKFSEKINLNLPKFEVTDEQATDKKYMANMRKAMTKGLVKAVSYVSKDLAFALDQNIGSDVWNWPRDTQRANGETVGSPRDIVDTGKLAASLELKESFLKTKGTIQIAYKAPYAALMHYGGAIQPYGNPNAATVFIPGRPWVEATINGTHGLPEFNGGPAGQKGFLEGWKEVFPSS